ncbi:MAG: GntR family transcriptional regulator [Pseudonocardia sp.]|nr:GntR family transcriptional regulator [Pseudonocardia sp.]
MLLGRTSRAEQVADILRTRIAAGFFRPGERLVEDDITEALGVSRNTLREAFRLLSHERLVSHELNRGVFVRVLHVADVVDLYRVRRHVECSVLRSVTAPPSTLPRIADAVTQGEKALDGQDWRALGTADIRFHQELVATAGSPRIDELMRGVLAELRLVFAVVDNPRWFHEPYLARNHEILAALTRGHGAEAATRLGIYLDDAEAQLVAAYAERIA